MRPSRRRLLGLLAAAAVSRGATAVAEDAAEVFPHDLTVLVAGPAGGGLDAASRALLSGLQGHLPAGTTIGRSTIGGVDGVTGANQFATLTAPDGSAALLVPGAASIAWLVGDSRVHFDPSRWVPVLAGLGPAIVVGRREGPPPGRPGAVLRVAAGGSSGPALAALLALDLLGARVVPVAGLDDEATALAALSAGSIDALLVRNAALLDGLAASVAPLFGCGVPDDTGTLRRSPLAPDVPTLGEYAAALGRPIRQGPLYEAWRCAAGAAQLRYALVLPSLTPASAVALWRDAGSHAFSNLAAETGVIHAADASGLMRALAPDSAALLDLRHWIATRLGWQPG